MSQSSICPPPRPSSSNPVIIYLPRGSPFQKSQSQPDLLPSLALSSNATVVRVNYRLSTAFSYPKPIHDVLAAYDWIKSHLGQSQISPSGDPEGNQTRKLGVCGEFIGGSLAAMLALTECHIDQQGISAAVLGNPVSDWTSLFPAVESTEADHLTSSHRHSAKKPGASKVDSQNDLTIDSLLKVRDAIFPRSAKFFDPFASPSLFFRTPSIDLPPAVNLLLVDTPSSEVDVPETLVRKRRSHRVHPPLNSNLQIPRIRVELGKEHVLHDQGTELAQLMRRSVTATRRKELPEEGEADAKDHIELLERDGMGLWGEKEADEVGRWFAEVLC